MVAILLRYREIALFGETAATQAQFAMTTRVQLTHITIVSHRGQCSQYSDRKIALQTIVSHPGHCEERSDEAISHSMKRLHFFTKSSFHRLDLEG
ncbi:hypothetical protein L0128_18950, partial [candidate division KSB1 bacterium]|nr:hypothetical protein [candidate division KSB1 bacterium]